MRHDPRLEGEAIGRAEALHRRWAGARPEAVIAATLAEFPGRVALISSFGADSAVLLHMLSRIDRRVPVLLLETRLLFAETLAYQRALARLFGLADVRHIHPDAAALAAADPDATLHRRDPDACCRLRKVLPLERARADFPVLIDGRRRHQTAERARLALFEEDGTDRIKVSPLAGWTATEIRAYRERHALPPHPLVARGYRSIGCAPCTTPVAEGEDERAGRWRGSDKTECGIHYGPDGRIMPAAPATPEKEPAQ
jgi:phosphoadenosine phosphosulfate reductase